MKKAVGKQIGQVIRPGRQVRRLPAVLHIKSALAFLTANLGRKVNGFFFMFGERRNRQSRSVNGAA